MFLSSRNLFEQFYYFLPIECLTAVTRDAVLSIADIW